jgi:hypothetical protein
MRHLLLCVVIASCSHPAPVAAPDPSGGGATVTPPGAKTASPLTIDLELLCSPNAQPHATTFPEFAAWYEPQLVSADMKQELRKLKASSISMMEFEVTLNKWLGAADITRCATRDTLFEPNSAAPTP